MKISLKTLMILFAVLLVFTVANGINTARAALIYSEEYVTQFEMYHIGITLLENDKPVAWRNRDSKNENWIVNKEIPLFGDIRDFRYGETYPEVFTVKNSGSIEEYVRVTIYKYWLDEKGNKDLSLDPGLIELRLKTDGNWMIDPEYSADPERTVLYYALPLAVGESSDPFTDTLTVNSAVKEEIIDQIVTTDADGYTTITAVYRYNDRTFCVEIEADGVQTHNAADALQSAWGRSVQLNGERLQLK